MLAGALSCSRLSLAIRLDILGYDQNTALDDDMGRHSQFKESKLTRATTVLVHKTTGQIASKNRPDVILWNLRWNEYLML